MPEKEKEEGGEVKVVSDKQNWYVGLDGDNMGHTVEDSLVENDIAQSQMLEKQIKGAFAEIEEYIAEKGGKMIFYGGDNILFTVDGDPKEIGEDVRAIYKEHTDHSATVGIGHEPVEAHKALVIGKNTGKDQVVVWSDSQQSVYDDVKSQQDALEKCEDEIREDSDLEVGSSDALKYRAKTHYDRLIGLGYEDRIARNFVDQIYGASYRDLLRSRKKNLLLGTTPVEAYLIEGEQRWAALVHDLEEQENARQYEDDSTPTIEQKFVAKKGVGLVRFVGNKFISVEWLNGQRERIALKNFRRAVRNEEFRLVPKVRVARKSNAEIRRQG